MPFGTARLEIVKLTGEVSGTRRLRALAREFGIYFSFPISPEEDHQKKLLELEVRSCSSVSWAIFPSRPLSQISLGVEYRSITAGAPIRISTLPIMMTGQTFCCVTELAIGRDSKGVTCRFFDRPVPEVALPDVLRLIGELPIV